VHGAELVIRLLRHLGNDVRGLGGIVAADVEEITHVVLPEHLEHFFALDTTWLEAHRAQGRSRRGGDQLELLDTLRGQIDEVFLHDPGDAVTRAQYAGYVGLPARRQYRADQRLVDDHGGAAGLTDNHFADQFALRSAAGIKVFRSHHIISLEKSVHSN
jgi:hypothetical protein